MKLNKLLTVVISVVALMGLTIPAQADRPPTNSGSFTLDTTYCPFPLFIDYDSHQRTTTTFLSDGTKVERSTGNADATLTNLVNLKSEHYKINGPITVTTYTSGAFTIDATGPNLLYTTAANSFPGIPPVIHTTGHVQVAVDATGKTTSFQLSGRLVNVCAALS